MLVTELNPEQLQLMAYSTDATMVENGQVLEHLISSRGRIIDASGQILEQPVEITSEMLKDSSEVLIESRDGTIVRKPTQIITQLEQEQILQQQVDILDPTNEDSAAETAVAEETGQRADTINF